MESKELIQSYLHGKALYFICSRLENLLGGGGCGPNNPLPLGLICYSKQLGRPRVNILHIYDILCVSLFWKYLARVKQGFQRLWKKSCSNIFARLKYQPFTKVAN